MTEINAATAEPAYVSKLALQRLPFAVMPDKNSFFEDQQIQQRRQLILHLLRSTQTPIYLSAPTGMGKSAMLMQLQQREARDLRFCELPVAQIEQALDLMVRAFEASSETDATTALQQRLTQLRRLNIVPVLLIDDADRLSDAALMRLAEWLTWRDEDKPLLQAVLTGRASNLPQLQLQNMDLPFIEVANIPAYLQFRLEAVGHTGALPFNPKQLKRIIRQSQGGVPAKINQSAHQQLLGINPIIDWQAWLPANLGKTLRWFFIVMVSALVLAVLYFQDTINAWMNPMDATEKSISIPQLANSEKITPVTVGDEAEMADDDIIEPQMTVAASPEPTIDELSRRDELAALLAGISMPGEKVAMPVPRRPVVAKPEVTESVAAVSDEASEKPIESTITETQTTQTAPTTESVTTPSSTAQQTDNTSTNTTTPVTEQTAKPTAAATAQTTSPAKTPVADAAATTTTVTQKTPTTNSDVKPTATSGSAHNRDWILAQNGRHFTFQLMGAWQASELDAYIKKYRLTGDVARFSSMRDGKPWHVLIYGNYPSKQAALAASNQWQPPLKGVSTWLRRFDGVQKQIKDKGVSKP